MSDEMIIYCKMCRKPQKHFDLSADPSTHRMWKCMSCGEYNEVNPLGIAIDKIEAIIANKNERAAEFQDSLDKNKSDVHFSNLMKAGLDTVQNEIVGLTIALDILKETRMMKDVEVTRS